ncbi:hypothetical protein ANOM_007396 [Aspergillus nomiae NRRL 13137]|uniref:Tr-type G domain-containing protein n=1 Tax=Aspergillus nomiae NRRL (strain ATCC 15546 / NRRL 13137 / CBS 260.88 / M93) TaxID=1509407 RepID=A0A0L1IXM0_ASPN3|nr:uncharacterized protein ANOM_007396 [Aspergillus nomiae NRRL 13137]KNG84244.1 hypothetical protein ANOM_007396 [Aspergillus nomiae NRRL 13137]
MSKTHLNIVVIGSAGSGKSMTIGYLISTEGQYEGLAQLIQEHVASAPYTPAKDYAKAINEYASRENGDPDAIPSWNMETPKYTITLYEIPDLDSFHHNVSTGIIPADCALLVISASSGETIGESENDQTIQFAERAHELGIPQIAVAVTKLDTVRWDGGRFNEIFKATVHELKHKAKYNPRVVAGFPIAAAHGDNMLVESPNLPWYKGWTKQVGDSVIKGKTLLDAIDGFEPPVRRRN